MLKRIIIASTVVLMLLFAAVEVFAQGVLMNSAETIQKGNFKLGLFPTVQFGKNGSESVFGMAGRAGFGFTSSFDIEGKVAFFKGLAYYGIDAEFWFIKGPAVNVSAALGGHLTNVDAGADSSGIDTSLLVSTRPTTKLEIYGGLMLAFDSVRNTDYHHTLAHIVPGIEYKLSAELDFLAEIGIALNDNSRSYASVGFAYYFLQ